MDPPLFFHHSLSRSHHTSHQSSLQSSTIGCFFASSHFPSCSRNVCFFLLTLWVNRRGGAKRDSVLVMNTCVAVIAAGYSCSIVAWLPCLTSHCGANTWPPKYETFYPPQCRTGSYRWWTSAGSRLNSYKDPSSCLSVLNNCSVPHDLFLWPFVNCIQFPL